MKIKLKENNKNIDDLIQKINEKVIELKKNNFFNNEEVKKDIEKIYNSYIIKWMENHFILNNEMSPEFEEKFIDILLDFYNKLNKISNKKHLKENYEDRLGKNLAKKKYFINQAIQNKIANLPPGPPPKTDKQFVNNIEYYQQLVQQSRFSPKTREFINGVINNIKQHQGLASPKQLTILQKLKLGYLKEIQVGPKKYSRQEVLDLMNVTLKQVKKNLKDKSPWTNEIISFLKKEPYLSNKHILQHIFEGWLWDKDTSEIKIQQLAQLLLNFQKKHLNNLDLNEIEIGQKPPPISKIMELVFELLNSNNNSLRTAVNNYTLQKRYNDNKQGYFLDQYLKELNNVQLIRFYQDLKKLEKEFNEREKNELDESRISDLKSKFVGKSLNENEFNQMINISVPKPIYTEWLINVYIKEFKSQGKNIDDFLKEQPDQKIEYFEKNKNLFSNKDITSYSFNSLNQEMIKIDNKIGPASQALSNNDLDKLNKAGFKNLGIVDDYQIIKIPKGKNSPRAWQAYKNIICQGRTRVCTASNYTRFEYYTTNDNFYLLVNSNDEAAPYHISKFTNQIKDKDDQDVTDQRILNIAIKLK